MQDGRVIGKVRGSRVVKVPPFNAFNKEPMVERNPFVKEIEERRGKTKMKVERRDFGVLWNYWKERTVVKVEENNGDGVKGWAMVEVSRQEAIHFKEVFADEEGKERVKVMVYMSGEVKFSKERPTYFIKVKPEEADKFSNKILLGAGFYPVASP